MFSEFLRIERLTAIMTAVREASEALTSSRSNKRSGVDGSCVQGLVYNATIGETESEEPGLSTLPQQHARSDVFPIRELPYGLAALIAAPGRWQHATRR